MNSPARPSLYLAWAAFQRRQVSMADLAGFECVFLPLAYKGTSHLKRAFHYLALLVRTLRLLIARRPPVIWVQLPQMPLLWAALAYRRLFDRRARVVADCHNAVFAPPWSRVPFGIGSLSSADLVLVHNSDLRARAIDLGVPAARLRVLEDVPPLRPAHTGVAEPAAFAGRPRPWVLFAGSYGRDEPVAEVLAAARELAHGTVAITGRLSNAAKNGHDISTPPNNVVLTGYVPVAEFDALMEHCDVALAFTRHDGIQLSVCNEALGFGRPLVMSDTSLLRRLFGAAAVAVDSNNPRAIVYGIRQACAEAEDRVTLSRALARQRRQTWRDGPLRECLALLADPSTTPPAAATASAPAARPADAPTP